MLCTLSVIVSICSEDNWLGTTDTIFLEYLSNFNMSFPSIPQTILVTWWTISLSKFYYTSWTWKYILMLSMYVFLPCTISPKVHEREELWMLHCMYSDCVFQWGSGSQWFSLVPRNQNQLRAIMIICNSQKVQFPVAICSQKVEATRCTVLDNTKLRYCTDEVKLSWREEHMIVGTECKATELPWLCAHVAGNLLTRKGPFAILHVG